jgi:monoamine oxidase
MLEARDRIGGRVFTDASLGAPYDAGAYYIHWAERNPWRAIASELGVAVRDDRTIASGAWLSFENGTPVDRASRRRQFGELSRRFDPDEGAVPDVSFTQRVADAPELLPGARGLARMAVGDEPERISALDYARLWEGDDLIVPEGYGALAQRFGAAFPVKLSTPVTHIRWDGRGVLVESPAGSLSARAVIVTVPVGVLAAGAIRFTPELPVATREGLGGLSMGALTKIGLRFDGNRFGLPVNSNLWDESPGIGGVNFECWPFDRNLILALFGGDFARDVLAKGERVAVETMLDRLTAMLGPQVRAAFMGASVNGWATDPYAMGCYSHARPGEAGARAKLAQPVGERIWFAGEATAVGDGDFGAAMTAGGAFLAGEAAVRAVRG